MGANASIVTEWDPFMDPEVLRNKLTYGSKHGSSSSGSVNPAGGNDQSSILSPSTSSTSLSNSHASGSGTSGNTAMMSNSTASHHSSSAATDSRTTTSGILMGSNAPLLYEHALIGNWEELLSRIQTHPKEAKYTDKCRNMPLHVSCRRQPPSEVVDALVEAYPEALQRETMDGLTPLHFVCFCGSHPDTVERVLNGMMNMSSLGSGGNTTFNASTTTMSLMDLVDRRGRTPLHCVCAGFRSPHRLEVVRILLQMDPSCATVQDERNRTPLSLIIDDYAEELQEALQGSTEEARRKCFDKEGDLYECWEVTSLLLKAAYRGTIQDDRFMVRENEVSLEGEFRILHAAVGVGSCPSVFIRLILKTDPSAISQRDGDLNLPLHIGCRTVPQPWSRNLRIVITKSQRGSTVYNADFGRRQHRNKTSRGSSRSEDDNDDDDDMTAELLEAYPTAASVKDEFGKLPFVLAVESGKSWSRSLRPLWNAHPIDYDTDKESFEMLREAMDGALTSVSEGLRKESIPTLGRLAELWPKAELDNWVMHVIEFGRDSAGLAILGQQHHHPPQHDDGSSHSSAMSMGSALQASKLEGLASVLNHVSRYDLHMPDTPQQALEFALPLLTHKDPSVRVGASNVLGACVSLMGIEARERAYRDIIFVDESGDVKDDASMSTIGGISIDTTLQSMELEMTHGRALALHSILKLQPQILTESQTITLKEWMRNDEPLVREAACLSVGYVLLTPNDLKEYRSPLRKCMKATEDKGVLMAVARSLARAARENQDKLFLRKNGLPLLDAALMLSMTTAVTPSVQNEFFVFLCWAIQKQQNGLQDYMDLAQGENGKIMMSLATKTLSRLASVVEEDSDDVHHS